MKIRVTFVSIIDSSLVAVVNSSFSSAIFSTESDDEYSDDDDMSWKVRRSSVKCLEAIISSRRDLLVELYGSVGPTLVSRFKEREENVKTDIFLAFVALLKQTRDPHSPSMDTGAKEEPAVTLLKNQVC